MFEGVRRAYVLQIAYIMEAVEELGTDEALKMLEAAAKRQGAIVAREMRRTLPPGMGALDVGAEVYRRFMAEAGAEITEHRRDEASVTFLIKRCPFYDAFLDRALEMWLDRDSGVHYVPYLMGSRYSLEPRKAELKGLTQATGREEILAAIVRGLCEYQKGHLDEIGRHVGPLKTIHVTGGAVSATLIRAKQKWMHDGRYIHEQESSVKGAAMLARLYLRDPGAAARGPAIPDRE